MTEHSILDQIQIKAIQLQPTNIFSAFFFLKTQTYTHCICYIIHYTLTWFIIKCQYTQWEGESPTVITTQVHPGSALLMKEQVIGSDVLLVSEKAHLSTNQQNKESWTTAGNIPFLTSWVLLWMLVIYISTRAIQT